MKLINCSNQMAFYNVLKNKLTSRVLSEACFLDLEAHLLVNCYGTLVYN